MSIPLGRSPVTASPLRDDLQQSLGTVTHGMCYIRKFKIPDMNGKIIGTFYFPIFPNYAYIVHVPDFIWPVDTLEVGTQPNPRTNSVDAFFDNKERVLIIGPIHSLI